jgi:hypothetical protein
MRWITERAVMLLGATMLGYFLVSLIWQWRADYWLLTDSKQGIALITNKYWGGHGVYEYEYEVNQHKYAGRSRRNFKEEKYRNVGPGGTSIVFYSDSHPWLSALDRPDAVGTGWPFLLVALPIEFLLILTATNPKSKWALKTDTRK